MQSLNILLVDDFERFREAVCMMLQRRSGFVVIGQASNGLEAVRQAQELQPELILLDIGLPKLNGIEACRRIRELSPDSKILFLSQELSAEFVHEAFRIGARGYLHKSDVACELLPAMDAILEGKQFLSSRVKPFVSTCDGGVADYFCLETPQMPPRPSLWRVSGTYFEACNCRAICPCRKPGGIEMTADPTFGVCDFALSWHVVKGVFADVDVSDRFVVMAGSYRDDELGEPWPVILYVDERSSDEQFAALSNIFLGRAGGPPSQNYGARIGATYAIRRAGIELDHKPGRWFMRASTWVEVRATRMVSSDLVATSGIPGHEQSGNELVVDAFHVDDGPLGFDLRGRCGFEAHFEYSSHAGA
jgi:CheY-like chemotaxis protein